MSAKGTLLNYPLSDVEQFRILAYRIRYHTLLMIHRAGSSHIGTSFSMAELLAVLYGKILRINPAHPDWPDRDRFVLSKGHGCAALYAVLAERGFFPLEWLDAFYQNGSRLPGHATHTYLPGVEVSTGSLGHGLSIACGMALAAKRDGKSYRVFTLLSDGECDEGSTWEAVLFASHHQLDNLIAIVDYNKIQSLGRVEEVINLEPFAEKWRSFGWAVREIDGHDVLEVEDTLIQVPFEAGRPSCVIAHTVKGKGVSFMEGKLLWHYRSPQGEEYEAALVELEAQG
ncbi:MAG TPA: transketolase [Methylomirabilota bacterium]|nr:transketolase [Methylomirabilota bacterium]